MCAAYTAQRKVQKDVYKKHRLNGMRARVKLHFIRPNNRATPPLPPQSSHARDGDAGRFGEGAMDLKFEPLAFDGIYNRISVFVF